MDDGGSGAFGVVWVMVYIAIVAVMLAAMWMIFTKAGKPGWAAIIPIYNLVVLLEIVGKPLWWIILYFIPIVNIVVVILVYAGLARSFGKGGGFVVGMIFLPFIFFPILGFGADRYLGPAG
jgi:hypothetical protein